MEQVGRVEALWRHPVKSMRGQRVAEADLRWSGLAGDRRYAFVRADDTSNFPWLTGRVVAELLRYQPHFADESEPRRAAVRVRSPAGLERAIEDPELLRELQTLYGGPLALLHASRGLHDSSPVSLIGAATVRALCENAGVEPEMRRFRNNLVVAGARSEPFEEERWLGCVLQLGDRDDAPRIRIDRRNERCTMITLDPWTAERTNAILSSLAREHETCAGLYASVVRPGIVREGEPILAIG